MDNEELALLAAQYDAEEVEEIIVEDSHEEPEEIEEPEDVVAEDQEEPEGNPPGFIDNMEDWVAAGKDPDKFRGKKAYQDEYTRIQEVKELNAKFKQMQETLKSTIEAVARRDEQADAQHRKELEVALRSARDDGDTDAALEAQEQLQALKSNVKPRTPTQNPVIGEFLGSNPVLESEEVKGEFARIYNGKLRADGVAPDEQLSEAAMRGYLRASMESVKTIFPERFASPRLSRQSKPQLKAKPAAKALDIESALRSFKVDGASSRNQSAAYDIYNMLKKDSPDAAENYAKSILGVK